MLIYEECCLCDDCGKELNLLQYYQQDGLCSDCFIKWMEVL